MSLQEYLCFIASISNLWFGFSIIMLTQVCLVVYKRVNNIINYKPNVFYITNKVYVEHSRQFKNTSSPPLTLFPNGET